MNGERPPEVRAGDPSKAQMQRIFVTGTAGFIGYHLAELLLAEGFQVHGYDGLTDYYDVRLKRRRQQRLLQHPNFAATESMLEDSELLRTVTSEFQPDVIVHLAAQAGVRYSLENPRAYVDSNVVGTFNILEIARQLQIQHLLMASTSSVYGANQQMPFRETEKADAQLTIYSATKKATESMAHSYANLFEIPITVLRFFSVYGTWGRPDLALFKFVDAMLDDRPIDIYNNGEMLRDFTFVSDLVSAIRMLIPLVPPGLESRGDVPSTDSLSPVAPFRIVNIGNSEPVRLLDFIDLVEEELGKTAIRNYMPMQPGDVAATWADATLLRDLTGYQPLVGVREGIAAFVGWFRDYYQK